MKINEQPRMPVSPDTPYAKSLTAFLFDQLKIIAQKLNAIGDGRMVGSDLTATAAPTTGMYAVGDFVRNSAPSEAGTASSKYVITGWICVASGSPGTFVECRSLTGN